ERGQSLVPFVIGHQVQPLRKSRIVFVRRVGIVHRRWWVSGRRHWLIVSGCLHSRLKSRTDALRFPRWLFFVLRSGIDCDGRLARTGENAKGQRNEQYSTAAHGETPGGAVH